MIFMSFALYVLNRDEKVVKEEIKNMLEWQEK